MKRKKTKEEYHEENIQRIMGSCIHFTGTQNKECTQGIPYAELSENRAKVLPCLGDSRTMLPFEQGKQMAECPLRQFKTREEAEEELKRSDERFEKIGKARRAIISRIEQTGISSGTMVCVVCSKGTLKYSRASNGHVHARCSTDGCVAWME